MHSRSTHPLGGTANFRTARGPTSAPSLSSLAMRFSPSIFLEGLTATNGTSWHREHPSIVLIEDHIHDPLSDWSQSSNADYAVASLRKTLPVPIGAMLLLSDSLGEHSGVVVRHVG